MTSEALSASLEDYLEAIFQICVENPVARVKEIAERLKVRAASVTGALQLLAEKGLINYEPYGHITLTARGKTLAEDVVRRHEALKDFFTKVLLVEPGEAEAAACRMEHVISREILDKFIGFVEFVELCPRGGEKWIKGFEHFCQQKNTGKECEKCVTLCLEELREKMETQAFQEQATITLDQVRPGQTVRVVRMQSKGVSGKRLVEMGVTKGAVIRIERVAPLGDPIDVRVKGYHLSLRKEEAAKITVSLV
jgi:DtxR family Mn-dependent transcriptional regulator